MSTFSGLTTALSGLNAARTGLNVVGANLTNVNTSGYTRQRVEQAAVGAPVNGSLYSAGVKPGQGVNVTGIARLGDAFLDARVRTAFSSAGYTNVRADALSDIQARMKEPGTGAVSGQLTTFWGSWQGVHNNPGDPAATTALLQGAAGLAQSISDGYKGLDTQWSQTRSKADLLAADVNSTASQVADLNDKIRTSAASGVPSSELIDQRNTLTARLSQLVGGTVRDLPNGGNEILLGGNVLVSGSQVNTVKIGGQTSMTDATAGPVQLEWTRRDGMAVDLDGGQLASTLSVLAPVDGKGTGGVIAETAAEYNNLAETLAKQVNDIHRAGSIADGTTGHDFFTFTVGPAALGLTVVPKDAAGVATAAGAAVDLEGYGSIADKISQIGVRPDSPDAQWTKTVIATGTAARTALQQDVAAGSALSNAVGAQQSNASVDIDEENVNLLAYQHAYQAAARVMTAMDEALDVLINQTGRVGR
ncbi:flagellar hook-associated protein FlgK [Arthrobacter livingstonensis]|uniref:Flagellar hook-associated protein 1 n=1 Tax=Arthrobacter livingstonensis TaxID=670078 RepID=A0A2V5LX28_9MICC|nr:flagellar hook-associated protein FlgK [Arthrobacter livingstonensis]PYI66846.1 flagellar hook-associated protein FlgK [Arthrobacter livingstonensis]